MSTEDLFSSHLTSQVNVRLKEGGDGGSLSFWVGDENLMSFTSANPTSQNTAR